MLFLEKDQSFSMTANIISPGYQSIVLKGYLVDRRPDGIYVAPLIPQLFYGVDGTQLTTWRQYFSKTGSQVVLSRVAGKPEVPREELFWRKVSVEEVERAKAEAMAVQPDYTPWIVGGLILSAIIIGCVLFSIWKG